MIETEKMLPVDIVQSINVGIFVQISQDSLHYFPTPPHSKLVRGLLSISLSTSPFLPMMK
jgi:hypothetical protein